MNTHLILTAIVVALSPAIGLAAETSPSTSSSKTGISVTEVTSLDEPAAGKVVSSDIHESETMVTRIMRLAPGATIKEHFHPHFDETFFMHKGELNVSLNDTEYEVKAGQLVVMPAGTIISGSNDSDTEAIFVITWANTGEKGPLFIFERPGAEVPAPTTGGH